MSASDLPPDETDRREDPEPAVDSDTAPADSEEVEEAVEHEEASTSWRQH